MVCVVLYKMATVTNSWLEGSRPCDEMDWASRVCTEYVAERDQYIVEDDTKNNITKDWLQK